jgi:hypothetical protein
MRYTTRPTRSSLIAIVLFLVLAGGLTGCLPSQGGGGKGERKKMLNLDGQDGAWEATSLGSGANFGAASFASAESYPNKMAAAYPRLPFTLLDTTIRVGGEMADFMLLRLPTADYDYLLLAAKGFESWLPSWLNAWPQSGRHGIVIDLSGGTATQRADFQVSCPSQYPCRWCSCGTSPLSPAHPLLHSSFSPCKLSNARC